MTFSPSTLGAPAKFIDWRRDQLDAWYRLQASDFRFKFTLAPTGSGKTLLAWSSHFASSDGGRTLILTSNRSLEDVYRDDFAPSLYDVRGQQNYVCNAVKAAGWLEHYRAHGTTVDRAPCHSGIYCSMLNGGCDYFDSVKVAAESKIVSTNYSFWLTLGKAVAAGRSEEVLGNFDHIVCDESHDAADRVCDALTVTLYPDEFRSAVGVPVLPVAASTEDWTKWAGRSLDLVVDLSKRLKRQVSRTGLTSEVSKLSSSLRSIKESLTQLSGIDEDWVVSSELDRVRRRDAVKFEPVWPADRCESLLYRGAKSVLFLSATMSKFELPRLGVPVQSCEVVEYPSSFPVQRRPVYVVLLEPQVRVDRHMDEFSERMWISRIDATIRSRLELGRKGIIHCVSYERARRILELSRYRGHMIGNADSRETKETLLRFRDPKGPLILVSPSVTQGEDFPDDQCRWILVPKLPFPNGTSLVMKRRKEVDPDVGNKMMMQSLVQSAGRHVRSVDDWGEVIVIDDHARWALPRYATKYATKSFNEALVWVRSIPEPLVVTT
jgi:Rad3-related DNA helicase